MITVHFYDEVTGLIRSGMLRASALTDAFNTFVSANTPDGCKPILGVKNARSQRVDVATGSLVDIPKQATSPRTLENDRRIRVAKRQMSVLEAQIMKPRAIREAILDKPGAKARIATLEAQIADLRKIITS